MTHVHLYFVWILYKIGAIFAIILFVPTRNFILRREDSFEVMLKVWPGFVWIVIFIMTLFLLKKGFNKFALDVAIDWGTAIWVSALCGFIIALGAWFFAVRSGRLEKYIQQKIESDKKYEKKRDEIFRRFSLQTVQFGTTNKTDNKTTTSTGGDGGDPTKSQLSPKGDHVPQNSSEEPDGMNASDAEVML